MLRVIEKDKQGSSTSEGRTRKENKALFKRKKILNFSLLWLIRNEEILYLKKNEIEVHNQELLTQTRTSNIVDFERWEPNLIQLERHGKEYLSYFYGPSSFFIL